MAVQAVQERAGIAMSFCDAEEIEFLKDIHKLIAKQIPVNEEHPYPMSPQSMVAKAEASKSSGGGGRSGTPKRGRGFGSKDRGRAGSGGGSGMSGASNKGGSNRVIEGAEEINICLSLSVPLSRGVRGVFLI